MAICKGTSFGQIFGSAVLQIFFFPFDPIRAPVLSGGSIRPSRRCLVPAHRKLAPLLPASCCSCTTADPCGSAPAGLRDTADPRGHAPLRMRSCAVAARRSPRPRARTADRAAAGHYTSCSSVMEAVPYYLIEQTKQLAVTIHHRGNLAANTQGVRLYASTGEHKTSICSKKDQD
ncbi:hypothetical protein SEVIR_3G305300v4 [Setaria viridis]|uniref:Uncharacterized protein n=1 Tax=Setaria viridis TaxID=4556 RepID=A0A4U6VFL5_SETVI|nr:hypothetical protein SEVIR_3G305300v2 [Setaria viridis]